MRLSCRRSGAPVGTKSWRDRLLTEAGKYILMGLQWAVIRPDLYCAGSLGAVNGLQCFSKCPLVSELEGRR